MDVYPGAVRGLTWTVLKRPTFGTIVQKSPNRYTTRISQVNNPIWTFLLTYEYLKNMPLDVVSSLSPWTDLETLMGFFMNNRGEAGEFLFSDPSDRSVGPALLTTAWAARTTYKVGDSIYDGTHWQKVTSITGSLPYLSGFTTPSWNHAGSTTSDGSFVWTDQGAYASGFPNPRALLSVVNDGAGTYYSPIQRNMGGWFAEDITDLDPLSVATNIAVYKAGVLQNYPTDYTLGGPGLAVPGNSFMGLYLQWSSNPGASPISVAFNFYFRVRFASDDLDFERFMDMLWTMGGSSGKAGKGSLELETVRTPAV